MLQELWEKHRGKCIGVIAGIFFGFIYLFTGFWEMLVFLLLVLIGYDVGRKIDRNEPWIDFSRIYRWFNERRNLFK